MKYLLLLLLTGCATTYEASRTNADGSTTNLMVKSHREFMGGIVIEYDRETGAFKLEAGDVQNNDGWSEAFKAIAPALIPK